MFKKTILSLLIVLGIVSGQAKAQELINDKIDVIAGSGEFLFNCVVYKPANYSAAKKYPLVLFFHGMGEAGTNVNDMYSTGLPKVLKDGYKPSFDFIMIAPQHNSYSLDPKHLNQVVDESIKKFPNIDLTRIYLTGLSAGGNTIYVSSLNIDQQLPKRFAAMVVMSGATQGINKNNFSWWKEFKTPLWAVVGGSDGSYLGQNEYVVNEVNKQVPGLASLTVRPGVGHGGWNDVYNGTVKTTDGKNMWQWLYQFTRTEGASSGGGAGESAPPSSDLMSSRRVLIDIGASATNTDQWGKVWNNMTDARPGVRVSNAKTTSNAATTVGLEVINRIDGTFSTSGKGINTGTSTGVVSEYPATSTTDFAFAHNTASNGKWRIFGLDATKSYTIKFWGTKTATANYTVQIKRADETAWQEYNASGNNNYNTAANFTFSGATEMSFDIRTKTGSTFGYISIVDITETGGSTGGSNNQAPTAVGGGNKAITLPNNTTVLTGSGTDTDGTIASYSWEKVSGPTSFTINNAAIAQPTLTSLVAGTYVFRLTVTDNGGATDTDDVTVTVYPGTAPTNQPPVANAGTDRTITLPTNNVSLTGTGTDVNGTITAYNWTKVAGPGQFTISNANVANPTISNLVAGTYTFRLTVTDNGGATATDDINVVVNSQPATSANTHTLQFNSSNDAYFPNGTGLNWKPGDTVNIPAGNYDLIDLGNIRGDAARPIIIRNKGGLVTVRQIRLNAKMEYFKILGNGHPGLTYGIRVDGQGEGIAFAAALVSHMEVAYVEIMNAGVGMMVKKNQVAGDPTSQMGYYLIQNIKIHHNYVHDIQTEGMYIGSTTPSGTTAGIPIRLQNVEINNNLLERIGWDGIQLSTAHGTNSIHDNVVRNFGTVNQSSQQTGIAIGGCATGDIYNNTISTGTGWGINVMGYGTIRVTNNLIENVGANGIGKGAESIYADDRVTGPEVNPKQQMIITGNTIKNPQPDGAIRVGAYNNNSLPSTISNNTVYLPNAASNWLTFYVVSNAVGSIISGNTVIR